MFLSVENRVVLADSDIAVQICPDKVSDTELLGTAGYAAPEQFGFSRCDQRTDIFAMEILLNIMLTGAHPSAGFYERQPLKITIEKCKKIDLRSFG